MNLSPPLRPKAAFAALGHFFKKSSCKLWAVQAQCALFGIPELTAGDIEGPKRVSVLRPAESG